MNNIITPVNNSLESNLDFYLYNNNCKYKKVIRNGLHFLALTEHGDVRATTCDSCSMGVAPENFRNVEDIMFIEDVPYIKKCDEYIPLYIGIE